MLRLKKFRNIDFTLGSIPNKIILFFIPLFLSTVFQQLFNAVDLAIIGKVCGSVYQSAVGSSTSTLNLIVNLFAGISMGANIVMATAYGKKSEEDQQRTVHSAAALGLCGGIFTAVVGISVSRPLLIVLNTPEEVLPYALIYLRLYLLSVPALVLYHCGAAIYRGIGKVNRTMYYLITASLLKLVVNVVGVVVLDLNVTGVAMGTVISQYTAAVWVWIDLWREKGAAKFSFRKMRFYKKQVLQMLGLGVPIGLSSCCYPLSSMFLQSVINQFDVAVIAGSSVGVNIEGLIDTFGVVFGHSVLTAMSQNSGAKQYDRMKKSLHWGLLLCGCAYAVIGILILFAGKQICAFYNSDPEVIEQAYKRLLFTGVPYVLLTFNEIYSAGLRGMGYAFLSMVNTMISICFLRILWSVAIFPLLNLGIEMLYIVFPISWAIAGIVVVLLYYICSGRFYKSRENNLQTEVKQEG